MEPFSWPESLPSNRIKAVQELTKGRILTSKLNEMANQPENIESDIKSDNGVVVQISEIFKNALSILRFTNPPEIFHNDVRSPSRDRKKLERKSIKSSMRHVKTKRGCYKRRKNDSRVTRVTFSWIDDGYAWRKYGQKVILNSKHLRNYYRCTHKVEQGCQAIKHVQRTDDEPSKYNITYIGHHTCNNSQRAPEIIMESLDTKDSTLISFEKNTVTKNNKVGTFFPSMKHVPHEGFPSLGSLEHEQVFLCDPLASWDPIMGLSQVPLDPTSMRPYALDCDDMVCPVELLSTYNAHGYKIDDFIESHDYGHDFLFNSGM